MNQTEINETFATQLNTLHDRIDTLKETGECAHKCKLHASCRNSALQNEIADYQELTKNLYQTITNQQTLIDTLIKNQPQHPYQPPPTHPWKKPTPPWTTP